MIEVVQIITMYGIPACITTGMLYFIWKYARLWHESRERLSRLSASSDNADRIIRDLEQTLMGRNGPPPKDMLPVGFLPPPPPPRRAVAQSSRATGENVSAARIAARDVTEVSISLARSSGMSVESAMNMLERAASSNMLAAGMMLTGDGTNQPAGTINAAAKTKPAKPLIVPVEQPKRKITLE